MCGHRVGPSVWEHQCRASVWDISVKTSVQDISLETVVWGHVNVGHQCGDLSVT